MEEPADLTLFHGARKFQFPSNVYSAEVGFMRTAAATSYKVVWRIHLRYSRRPRPHNNPIQSFDVNIGTSMASDYSDNPMALRYRQPILIHKIERRKLIDGLQNPVDICVGTMSIPKEWVSACIVTKMLKEDSSRHLDRGFDVLSISLIPGT